MIEITIMQMNTPITQLTIENPSSAQSSLTAVESVIKRIKKAT